MIKRNPDESIKYVKPVESVIIKNIRIWLSHIESNFLVFYIFRVTKTFFLRLTKRKGIFPYFMNRNPPAIGTPLLLALMLVSAVSLTARLYHDHGLLQRVEASVAHANVAIVQGE